MSDRKKYSVLLCTDEPTRAVGFRTCFDSHPEFMTLPHVKNAKHLTDLMASTFPHVVVLHGRAHTAKRVLASLKSLNLDTKVVLWPGDLPARESEKRVSGGLAAILEKNVQPEDLVSLVRSVVRGEAIDQAESHGLERGAGAR